MRKIQFTSDFANRSKGDIWEECPAMLASQLVTEEKVAKYIDEQEPEVKTKGSKPIANKE